MNKIPRLDTMIADDPESRQCFLLSAQKTNAAVEEQVTITHINIISMARKGRLDCRDEGEEKHKHSNLAV